MFTNVMKREKGRKIFQSLSPKRWKLVLWAFRTLVFFGGLILAVFLVDLLIMPYVYHDDGKLQALLRSGDYNVFETKYNKEFYELRQKLAKKSGTECLACINPHQPLPDSNFTDNPFNKQLLLVFDDGPHPVYTQNILDVLEEESVPAAFFIVGQEAERNLHILDAIHEAGFEIGNHTFTHPHLPETNVAQTLLELKATKRLIECVTGVSTLLFRPPFSEQPRLTKIPAEGNGAPYYYNIPESIDPRDFEEGLTGDSIFERTVALEGKGNVILLHDGGGDRSATVDALPKIIKHFKSKGYEFVSVADFLGLKPEDVMPPLKGDLNAFYGSINRIFFFGLHGFERIFVKLFILGMVLAIIRYLAIAILASIQHRRSKRLNSAPNFAGKVSIIVPGFNEEVTAEKTIDNLLLIDYEDFEIIFVDDGSTDNTYQKLQDKFGDNEKVTIRTKENGGKSSALNTGIRLASGEFIVCIDADTQLRHDAVQELIKYFGNEEVAAVAGNVKVGNERNSWTYWQSIEYVTSQNFDRRAFDVLNCITVIPGAIGAFRKSAILETGLFEHDTLAEDCELTMRLLKAGYRVRYNPKAIAVTEAPENLKQFIKQRTRWMFGIMQSFWKHKEMAFNPKYKSVGLVAFPNMIIFQLILPVLAPMADIMFLFGIILGNSSQLLIYFLLYLLVEAIGAALAFSFEKENMRRLIWLIPQRFVYRQILFYVLVKSIIKAIKGEVVKWGILKRTGNVETIKN